jgi:hypothetical protein
MPLDQTKKLIQYGVEAAKTLPFMASRNGHIRDPELWLLMQGFAGAFYAIWESLYSVQHNDPILKRALDIERADLKVRYDMVAGQLRKRLSHQAFTTSAYNYNDWEVDHFNDTEHPVGGHVFVTWEVDGADVHLSFGDWAQWIMRWWEVQIVDIERRYNRMKSNQDWLDSRGSS